MYVQAEKPKENKNHLVAHDASKKRSVSEATFQFVDNRHETVTRLELQKVVNRSLQMNTGRNQKDCTSPIQCLVADGYDKLYAPSAWFNTRFDAPRTETIRDVNNDHDKRLLKVELLNNLSETAGINISTLKEVNNGKDVTDNLIDGGLPLPTKLKKKRQMIAWAKSELGTVLNDLNTIIYPMTDGRVITMYEFLTKKIIAPKHLVRAPGDLAGGYDITKVCALIALYSSCGPDAVKTQIENNAPKSAAEFYEAMHVFYYGSKGLEYDEPSSHPSLYGSYGYKMIHSGAVFWDNLHSVLSKDLVTGKDYIFDLNNHCVHVTMKRNYIAGLGKGDALNSDFFDFHSDHTNFNTSELMCTIEYIYEKQ